MFEINGYQIIEQIYLGKRSSIHKAICIKDKLSVVIKTFTKEFLSDWVSGYLKIVNYTGLVIVKSSIHNGTVLINFECFDYTN